MTTINLEKVNKIVIILVILVSFLFTFAISYLGGTSCTISWQIYTYAMRYPEISLFAGLGFGRFVTKLEYNGYGIR